MVVFNTKIIDIWVSALLRVCVHVCVSLCEALKVILLKKIVLVVSFLRVFSNTHLLLNS